MEIRFGERQNVYLFDLSLQAAGYLVKCKCIVPYLILLLAVVEVPAQTSGPTHFFEAIADFTVTNENDEALNRSKFRRGDSTFSNAGLLTWLVCPSESAVLSGLLVLS